MLVFDRSLAIEERTRGGRCVLRLHGELDMGRAGELEALLRARARTHREVVLELAALSFVDSVGIRAILAGYEACSAQGHRLIAIGASRRVMRVLEICGLADTPPFSDQPGRAGSWPLSAVAGATRARPRRQPIADPTARPEPTKRPH